ncbi:unnamed protein product [Microthlaspi erraticum]|uniref:Reverse transcriptase Ty1/copia-type domain-containing protein n=1 Tax=Microthlaspi erraticum TaxID=1685480 RepID=A0A6D2I9E8_9BRAS|nr:unnamed protein product [Microthlaspi erraticum]
MTSDLHNLALHSPYTGGDDVLLGDGSAQSISHTDKNLISVFQLCSTNGVAVTFTPTYFQVRDLTTGALRLEGKPKDGTYEWPKHNMSKPPSLAYASVVKTSMSDWHSRLGHPAISVLQKMISIDELADAGHLQADTPVVSSVLVAAPSSSPSPPETQSSPGIEILHNPQAPLPQQAQPSHQAQSSQQAPPSDDQSTQQAQQWDTAHPTQQTQPQRPTSSPSTSLRSTCENSHQPANPKQTQPPPAPPSPTRKSNRQKKPVQKLNLSAIVYQSHEVVPTSVAEALRDPRWRAAMCEEIDNHIREHTWDLISSTVAENIVGSKWIFTIKRHANGAISKFKARLVAKGFNQRPGIDYHETFSPVIKPSTIRLVLSVSVSKNWQIRQFDVNHAFLQGKLDDEVYMTQPPGFVNKDEPQAVCKLRKAIYGLKQTPQAWYNELRTFLLQYGFVNSLADASLFIYNNNGVLLYMLVYVDDIILTGNSQPHLDKFITSLSNRFSLKDLGTLSYFLGMEAQYLPDGLLLTQRRYIADLLHKNNMTDCKSVPTPMCPNTKLTLTSGDQLKDPSQYRALVGSLQYLSLTRPDVSYAVNKLSQFMHKPTDIHWSAVKRILRYLSGTQSQGIFYSKTNAPSLHAYTDADWGGDKYDYISTGAYIVYYGKHPIAWSSKKQKGVSRSSTEAEYRAVTEAVSEVIWIKSLLTEMGITPSPTPPVYCDNIGATYLAANPVFHSRMKHLALDYHFVRNLVQSRQVQVAHVTSADQLADTLIKPLPRSRFQQLAVKIGLTTGTPS